MAFACKQDLFYDLSLNFLTSLKLCKMLRKNKGSFDYFLYFTKNTYFFIYLSINVR
ncbi:hypothetical protein HMPREF1981_02444 [Bacteroides pyogenes F0041]|uniref:Uncharacterized protein n=1 Tax=Bacteroides pyogenes F0041 TaxID=1321819 RepID=U2CJU6_9BACE|nr:hypothetical protein HMPREF1981_02444 [Bacteroides pyogenes F0041]GAE21450.1 hypothetical protein JCM10003_905 [Bacteroides pyogenes JCM 10003]